MRIDIIVLSLCMTISQFVFITSSAMGSSYSKNKIAYYQTRSKDISRLIQKMGYSDWPKIKLPGEISRNSDGTAIRLFDWKKGRALILSCDGSIKQINVPKESAWLNDDHEAVAWISEHKVFFKNGVIREPPFGFHWADTGGKYFIAKNPTNNSLELFSMENPKLPLAKLTLLGGGLLKIYSGYAVYSTIYQMLCLTTYNHFAWQGTTIYSLLHQTIEE